MTNSRGRREPSRQAMDKAWKVMGDFGMIFREGESGRLCLLIAAALDAEWNRALEAGAEKVRAECIACKGDGVGDINCCGPAGETVASECEYCGRPISSLNSLKR